MIRDSVYQNEMTVLTSCLRHAIGRAAGELLSVRYHRGDLSHLWG